MSYKFFVSCALCLLTLWPMSHASLHCCYRISTLHPRRCRCFLGRWDPRIGDWPSLSVHSDCFSSVCNGDIPECIILIKYQGNHHTLDLFMKGVTGESVFYCSIKNLFLIEHSKYLLISTIIIIIDTCLNMIRIQL